MAISRQSGRRPRRFLVFVGLVFLAAVEVGSRVAEFAVERWSIDPNPFVDAVNPVPVFEVAGEPGRLRYRRTKHHPLIMNNQSFSVAKRDNGYRVFLLGGSAAGGWPFEWGGRSIADRLQHKLERLYPDRAIEVINAAGGTYGSHRVKFVFDEVIHHAPDLMLIYSGNNEFLESYVFRRSGPPAPWNRLAAARLTHRVLTRTPKPSFDVADYTIADQRSNRLSYAFGRASEDRDDPERFERIVEHYRFNIESMLREAQGRGVPLMLLDVPVSLAGWAPNASLHRDGLSTKELAAWRSAFREGLLAEEAGDAGTAAAAFAKAAAADDRHAETHFRHGAALQMLGRSDEAHATYLRALETDAYPFRGLPRFREILAEVAVQHDVPLVETVKALEAVSRDGILGLEVLVDYVHLSEASQERVAQAVLLAAEARGLLPPDPSMSVASLTGGPPPRDDPALDIRAAEVLYRQYLIMRQYDRLPAVHADLVAKLERGIEAGGELAPYSRSVLDKVQAIQSIVEPYQRLLRADKLGTVDREFGPERARAVFDRYVQLIRELEAPEMSDAEFLEFLPERRYGAAGGA